LDINLLNFVDIFVDYFFDLKLLILSKLLAVNLLLIFAGYRALILLYNISRNFKRL